LLKKFQLSMGSVWPATQSQLYGELGKLTGAGLIEVRDVGPRGRKEYGITDDGRVELQRWMTSPQQDNLVDDALAGQRQRASAHEFRSAVFGDVFGEHYYT
jgi:PadR family transcriptional regulator, regulatory protein AphA